MHAYDELHPDTLPGADGDFLGCALLRTGEVRSMEKCAKFMLLLSHVPQVQLFGKVALSCVAQ